VATVSASSDKPEVEQPGEPSGGAFSLDDLFYGAVTVGERGQVVIPAEARRDANITPGDKLLVFRHGPGCGVALVKLDSLHEHMQFVQRVVSELNEESEEA
jgi:AbrB family looped-hinge helix DNA binding protein